MPAEPVTVAADEAFTRRQRSTHGQRLLQGLHGAHLCQPGRQVVRRLDLFQQGSGLAAAGAGQAEQAQLALIEAAQVQPVEIIQQDRLQVGAEYGFHRQLPAGFDAQPFGQPRALLKALLAQPFGGALARV